jgi:hypothetical protein
LRLLRLRFPSEKDFVDNVRVRPRLGLGFPLRDIEGIEQDEDGRYRIEANFFGLYGVTSPLPTFYTEDLIDEQLQGHSADVTFSTSCMPRSIRCCFAPGKSIGSGSTLPSGATSRACASCRR